MNTILAVVDEPVELCVKLPRYVQFHRFSFSFDFSAQKMGASRDTA
jgi:hypothetical protein